MTAKREKTDKGERDVIRLIRDRQTILKKR